MIGKIAYGLLFCLILPAVLLVWSIALDNKLPQLPSLEEPWSGSFLVLSGVFLMATGMLDLWRRGGGLPMNAFPPPRLVTNGVYRWLPHPIYYGFGMLVPGIALITGSGAGIWLITPTVWLGMFTLVLGYERLDLIQRFGPNRLSPWLWLPPTTDSRVTVSQKLAASLLTFVPWLIGYQAMVGWGVTPLALNTYFTWENHLPVWEWSAIFYLGAYLWVTVAPWVSQTCKELRLWIRDAWWGTGIILWCFLSFPFIATPRQFIPETWLGEAILLDRSWDTHACALPSFHVFWALMAARLWKNKVGKLLSYTLAGGIAVSCITVGNHSLLDVLAGIAVFSMVSRCEKLWAVLLRNTERVANSWKDWRIGRLRIINHGIYVGSAVLLGLWIVGVLFCGQHTASILTVALCTLIGACLWGQWLEASSVLSRPFGYYGGLFGGILGVWLSHLIWGDGWMMLSGFAVAGPVIQAVGRLRCLVQGCCHGKAGTKGTLGIQYFHPLSRVVKIAGLKGVTVYPTQLYSILSNLCLFGILMRLWIEGVDSAFIAGSYLLLSSCARFAEEAHRGEPQTIRWRGVAIYQWVSIICLLASMVLLAWPSPNVPQWSGWVWSPLLYAVPLGLITWFAMGVDFPDSNKRMSRLA